MIEPTSAVEQLMFCTVRIVGKTPNGVKTGTGFIYNAPAKDGGYVPLLITNKHVVDGTTSLEFILHTKSDPDANKPNGKGGIVCERGDWIDHPKTEIDLCALPLGATFNSMKAAPFFKGVVRDLLPSEDQLEDLNAVEEVLMFGYPNGLWDEKNNFPLVRRGITASHPAVDYDVNGVATTVIDMACFPGSSGSPVFLHNHGSFVTKNGSIVIGQSRTILLGILFSGPTIRTDGTIAIRNIPTVSTPVAELNLMMNLGYIIKASQLLTLSERVLREENIEPA